VPNVDRHLDLDRGAGIRCTFDRKRAAEEVGSLAHADETEPVAWNLGGVEPRSVIFDPEP
jgi:hypothetical protein